MKKHLWSDRSKESFKQQGPICGRHEFFMLKLSKDKKNPAILIETKMNYNVKTYLFWEEICF